MKVDAKELIQTVKLKGESKRGRVGLYLNTELYKRFQAVCAKEGVSASEIMDTFLKGFVESAEPKKR